MRKGPKIMTVIGLIKGIIFDAPRNEESENEGEKL